MSALGGSQMHLTYMTLLGKCRSSVWCHSRSPDSEAVPLSSSLCMPGLKCTFFNFSSSEGEAKLHAGEYYHFNLIKMFKILMEGLQELC